MQTSEWNGRRVDLLIEGGTLLTMDAKRQVIEGPLAIDRGRIVAVGDYKGDARQVLNAEGCAIMPGLVQGHVHLSQALFRGNAEGLPLLQWLETRIGLLEAAHDQDSMRASADLGLAEMLLGGTTCVLDMGSVHHHEAVFEAMDARGIRGASGKSMIDRPGVFPASMIEGTLESVRSADQLRAAFDQGPDGRLRYAYAPRFVLSSSQELLEAVAERSRLYDCIVHSHVAEQQDERVAIREALGVDDVEAFRRAGLFGPRLVLAHGVQLRPDEIAAMAAEGTRIVHCPSANLKLASGVAPVVAMRAAGLLVALGADGAPCNNRLDAFLEMREAALLAKVREADAAALGALDVLAMATIDGARALGLDHRVGSLEIGKEADLCICQLEALHHIPAGDVQTRLVYSSTAADVRHVFVGGRQLVRDGELCGADTREIKAKAVEAWQRLHRRSAA